MTLSASRVEKGSTANRLQSFCEICRSIRTPWPLCWVIGTTSALLASFRGCDFCSSVTGNQPAARAFGLLASPRPMELFAKTASPVVAASFDPPGGLIAAHFGFNTYGDFDMNNKIVWISILWLAPLGSFAIPAFGIERVRADTSDAEPSAPAANLFAAMDDGSIDVRYIAQDAQRANLLIKNNTNRVLHIQLPAAFAAVPVLAQLDRNQGLGLGMGGPAGGGGATQGVGGGLNQGQQGFGQGFGQGQGLGQGRQGFGMQGNQFGGMMRIGPEKIRKLTATTVCLEHGKPEPNPRVAYRIIPIEEFTADHRVATLCTKLARGEIKQDTAQALAWHFANGLNWDQLAKINRIESRYLGKIPMFSSAELKEAQSIASSFRQPVDDRYADSPK